MAFVSTSCTENVKYQMPEANSSLFLSIFYASLLSPYLLALTEHKLMEPQRFTLKSTTLEQNFKQEISMEVLEAHLTIFSPGPKSLNAIITRK